MEQKLFAVLNALMSDEGVSKNKLSKEKSIARKSITAYLNGECLPRYNTLAKISDYFEVSSDYLLGLEKYDGKCYKTQCEIQKIPDYFISQLDALLKEKGVSQNKLSENLKIDATTVSKWFNFKTMPETPLLISIAKVFDCKVDYLINRFETKLN